MSSITGKTPAPRSVLDTRASWLVKLLLIACAIWLCNHWTIFAADDYGNYGYTWLEHDTFDLQAVVNSTNVIYNGITGRWLSTFVNGVFLFFSNYTKEIFNVVNTVMFVLMLYYLDKIVTGGRERAKSPYWTLFIAVWFFVPAFGQSMFWEIGSVIYLWPLVAALAWMAPYAQMTREELAPSKARAAGLFAVGLLAGNGHEITAGMACCFVGLLLLMRLFAKKRVPAWAWVGCAGMLAGLATNLLSPGVINRFGMMGSGDLPPYGKLALVFYSGFCNSNMSFLFIIAAGLSIAYYACLKRKAGEKLNVWQTLFLVSTALLSLFVFALALLTKLSIINATNFWMYVCMIPLSTLYAGLGLFGLVFAFAVFCFFKGGVHKDLSPRDIVMIIFSMISAIITLLVFYIAPYSWPRSYICTAIMMIVTVCYILCRLLEMYPQKNKRLLAIPAALAACAFAVSFYNAAADMRAAYQWQEKTRAVIYEEIAKGSEYITVPTFMSENSHNAASVEKWVLPAVIDDEVFRGENGVHIWYEWINIEQTNYYFHDKYAWSSGKRIIGVE